MILANKEMLSYSWYVFFPHNSVCTQIYSNVSFFTHTLNWASTYLIMQFIHLVCNAIRDTTLSFLGLALRTYLDFGATSGHFGDEAHYELGGYCLPCSTLPTETRDLEISNNNKLRQKNLAFNFQERYNIQKYINLLKECLRQHISCPV